MQQPVQTQEKQTKGHKPVVILGEAEAIAVRRYTDEKQLDLRLKNLGCAPLPRPLPPGFDITVAPLKFIRDIQLHLCAEMEGVRDAYDVRRFLENKGRTPLSFLEKLAVMESREAATWNEKALILGSGFGKHTMALGWNEKGKGSFRSASTSKLDGYAVVSRKR